MDMMNRRNEVKMPIKVAKMQSYTSGQTEMDNETSEIIYSVDVGGTGKPKLSNHFKKRKNKPKKSKY